MSTLSDQAEPRRGRFDAVLLDVGDTLLFLDDDAVSRELRGVGVDLSAAFVREAHRTARLTTDERLWRGAPDAGAVSAWKEPLLDALGIAEPDLRQLVLDVLVSLHESHRLYRHVPRTTRDGLDALGIAEPDLRHLVLDVLVSLHESHRLYRHVPRTTRDGLDALSALGIPLAAVANSDGGVETRLEVTGLARHFRVIVDSSVVGVRKPDPRIFAIALERLSVPAARAVHAGDMLSRDVLGARGAGLAAVLVDEDGRHFAGPDVPRVRDVSELPAFLGRL